MPRWLDGLLGRDPSPGDPRATGGVALAGDQADVANGPVHARTEQENLEILPPPPAPPPAPGVDRLQVKPGEKWLILGITQSGKSVLARELARSWQYGSVIVIDTKGEDVALIPNARLCYWAEDVVRALPGRVVWRPAPAERIRKRAGYSAFPPLWGHFEAIAHKVLTNSRGEAPEPTLIVAHELKELCSERAIGPEFRECITSGAGLGISLALVTQRPQRVWTDARSEAHHVVLFTLASASARAEAADLMDDPTNPAIARLIRTAALPLDHSWLHRGPDWRVRRHRPIVLRAG